MSVDAVSAAIMKLRREALVRLGQPPEFHECPTCGNSRTRPYRQYNDRQYVTYGCVDAFHTGHLVPRSESNRWQNGGEARALRKKELAHLRALSARFQTTTSLTAKQRDCAHRFIAKEVRTGKYSRDQAVAIGMSRARREC